MGANLCSFRHPITDDHGEPKHESFGHVHGGDNSSSQPRSVILNLIRRPAGCLQKSKDQRAKKRGASNALLMHPPADQKKIIKKSKVVRKLTLEDWILNSPAAHVGKPDFQSGGELHVFRHSSRRVHPSAASSSSVRSSTSENRSSLASNATDSFRLEPVVKSAYPEADHGASSSTLSRSRSGKSTKRVSFGEEPDIIIFYSPDQEALSTDHQDSIM